MTTLKQLKIYFFSFDGAGHLAACYGLAQELVNRGHQITFFLNSSFKSQAEKYGCREIIFSETEQNIEKKNHSTTDNPIKAVADELLSLGMLGPNSAVEKMKLMNKMDWFSQHYDSVIKKSPVFQKIINEESPDLFIFDHCYVPPVVPMKGIKYVNLFSGNPIFLQKSPNLPPGCSGYRTDSDPAVWTEMIQLANEFFKITRGYQNQLNDHFGYNPPVPETTTTMWDFEYSSYLNIYAYPKELCYTDISPMPENFLQIDAFCRQETETFTIPKELEGMPGKALIYFSMGSMGSIDVDLMKKFLSIFAQTPYKFIVSKGPRAGEYDLPPNCWGKQFLPQTAILPLVDLVITHGGNNTFTECLAFGKKMIVLGLFADQLDNGARIVEKGYGDSFNPYKIEKAELLKSIDRLLADEQLTLKLQQMKDRIAKENRKAIACQAIECLFI